MLDGYAGVWFYTTNNAAFAGPTPAPQTLTPVGSFEGHLSRDFGKRRFWASLDGNFWFGGIASLNGVQNLETKQTSSRIGGTYSYPINRHQSFKANYSDRKLCPFRRQLSHPFPSGGSIPGWEAVGKCSTE